MAGRVMTPSCAAMIARDSLAGRMCQSARLRRCRAMTGRGSGVAVSSGGASQPDQPVGAALKGVDGVLRLRPSPAALLVRLVPLLILAAMAVVDRVLAPVSPRHGGFPLPVAAVLLLVVASWMRDSTVLTVEGIVTSHWWARRVIRWSLVQGFEVVPDFGLRGVQVVTGDGARVRLRAPAALRWFPASLEQDLEVMRGWWWTYRGPRWQPMARDPWSAVGLAVDDPWRLRAPDGAVGASADAGPQRLGGGGE